MVTSSYNPNEYDTPLSSEGLAVKLEAITDIRITDPGSGFTANPSVVISRGAGDTTGVSGAASAFFGPVGNINGGKIIGVDITEGGLGYQEPPTVTFGTGGGTTRATGTAVLSEEIDPRAYTVEKVTVLTPGTGYDAAPVVSFSGGGGRWCYCYCLPGS